MRFDPFNIIIRPLITEKTTHEAETGVKRYAFEVDPRATKIQIRNAIPFLFGSAVKVKSVNTMTVKPKARRVRGKYNKSGVSGGYKKAVITLTADSKELNIL
jgi:large subunit ribosomal protein L23